MDKLAHRFTRPYVLTGGRTRGPGAELPIETVVVTIGVGSDPGPRWPLEARGIVELCRDACSIMEIGAHLAIPVGVARVLVADLAALGVLAVGRTATVDAVERVRQLERLLVGIRAL
jgi:hypothetical protein